MRDFHIGDILTITTGRMVSAGGMGAIYGILNYMTGENLYTHQLPRAVGLCGPLLLRQHPQLADVDASTVNDEATATAWLAAQVARFGETLPVEPAPPGEDGPRDPVQELMDMVGRDRVAVVRIDVDEAVEGRPRRGG